MVKLTSITTTLVVSVVSTLRLTVPAQAEDISRVLRADAGAVYHGTDSRGSACIA